MVNTPAIGIIGVPIICIQMNPYGRSPPTMEYQSGLTKHPLYDIERILLKDEGLSVVNFGEIPYQDKVLMMDDFKEFGQKIQRLGDGVDVLLVIGGDHTSAYPIYYFSGNVIRADHHGDAFMNYWEGFNCATYSYYVVNDKLKENGQIWNVGLPPNPHFFVGFDARNVKLPKKAGIIDIDLDVLSEEYELPHPYSCSDLKIDELSAIIARYNSKVIGIFDCINLEKRIPENIISGFPSVFVPLLEAVSTVARYRKTHQFTFLPR